MNAHKHAEVIAAYAEGKVCQVLYPWPTSGWRDFTHESNVPVDWNMENCEYRVKPAAPVIETKMTDDELSSLYDPKAREYVAVALRRVGNAVVARAVVDGQVVPTAQAYANLVAVAKDFKAARDKLLTVIAAAYQIAGAHDAPERILDVLSDPEVATDAQIEAMLPYRPDWQSLTINMMHTYWSTKEGIKYLTEGIEGAQQSERAARDMAVAEAVMRATRRAAQIHNGHCATTINHQAIDLAAIIAEVKP